MVQWPQVWEEQDSNPNLVIPAGLQNSTLVPILQDVWRYSVSAWTGSLKSQYTVTG